MRLQNKLGRGIYLVLLIVLFAVLALSIRYGAVGLSIDEIYSSLHKLLSGTAERTLNERIFITIRLPRALMCVLVGGGLAVGGTLMQALFRNPIVEPGLIGTSSGAAFGSALYFVLGASFGFNAGQWTLPLAAGAGAIVATTLVFTLSRSRGSGRSSVVALLLTGLAVNALLMSGVGFLSYIARDPQARSITFWGLGNLSGANWSSVQIVGAVSILGTIAASHYAKQLNALMLGEDEAIFLGVRIGRLKLMVLLINVAIIATATAFVGIISFIGLIAPHLMRIVGGSDNRRLIPTSALMGAILLTLADVVARMAVRPAELPIGIVTSVIGVPVFLFLLRSKNYFF